jgi:hypothetical protein
MPSPQEIQRYVEKYRNKATVVRQIHSNIAESKRKWDMRHTVMTIVLGAIITFSGFMGTDRIFDTLFSIGATSASKKVDVTAQPATSAHSMHAVVQAHNDRDLAANRSSLRSQQQGNNQESDNSDSQKNVKVEESPSYGKKLFDFVFNGAVLLLFITSVLNLIYRWKEDHTSHFQGVVKLTTYINWLDEIKLMGVSTADTYLIKKIRGRYQVIVESLPPNDEKDYLRAKHSLVKKEKNSSKLKNFLVSVLSVIKKEQTCQRIDDRAPSAPDLSLGTDFIKDLIKKSSLLMLVLSALRNEHGNQLWLAGGAIRNYVWDQLTGRLTPQDDFDVVYFSSQNLEKITDQQIQKRLSDALPSVLKISVKNQARMHLSNGEPITNSFEEAIRQWPETATAIAIRLTNDGDLEIFAPYGVADLQNLIVCPTPYHRANPGSYNFRTTTKGWSTSWPELKILPAIGTKA